MDALTVTIKGEAKELKVSSGVPGIYVLGPNSINGKSHWLQESGSNAIWYGKYGWSIGSQNAMVSSRLASMISFEYVASPQLATTWEYFDGSKFSQLEHVLVEPGTFIIKTKQKHQISCQSYIGYFDSLFHFFLWCAKFQISKFDIMYGS